jgi:hypothetical protein
MSAARDMLVLHRGAVPAQPQPFRSAEAAWFWCSGFLAARRDGAGAKFGTGGIRPCEPDDILKALDRLYRQRRIDLAHARILRVWGEKGRAPDHGKPAERLDYRLWREAMTQLDQALRNRGIVA